MNKSIAVLELIAERGPKTIAQVRAAGLLLDQDKDKSTWYQLRQRFFLTTVGTHDGMIVCDITSKGKAHITKSKQKDEFVPIAKPHPHKEQVAKEFTVTTTAKTKYTKHETRYTKYQQPPNFMEMVR